ncbi:hypothetical protein AX15_001457 [Amanita polypyramis BW_CC]|nr:hypothetical protein AX15_001457 [Amanita polypyramis BW_CC]
MDDVAADIDLHIRIRHRIAAVLADRLDWALLLKHQLHPYTTHPAFPPSFKAAAHDAISSIESPSNVLLDYPPPVPPRSHLPPARPNPRQKPSGNPPPSFLYIRSSTLGIKKDHDEFYLLKCPQCSRTSFTTLQGLLNHARIAHRLGWGTHEECVRACAVSVSYMDTTAGAEVGLGPAGILPGLRSIFQMAVGVQSNPSTAQSPDGTSSQLTKLLGLHEDTPTLAPFLGKSPVRRGIKVYDEDDIVDVVSLEHQNTTGHWRLPLYPRNAASQRVHRCEAEVVSDGRKNVKPRLILDQPPTSLNTARSRFHFVTRIIVTDRSYWIPPHYRKGPYQHHSHKWMISIHSPSYAHDLTTILKYLKVTPVHDMGSATFAFSSPKSPPYVVVGTASSPFLANIELLFNGIGATEAPISDIQRVVVKHWVELDPLKQSIPVIGEEQTIDIELDKRTLTGPGCSSSIPIGSKVLWDIQSLEWSKANVGSETVEDHSTSGCTQILNRLVSLFPMTRESRTGRLVDVSYKLVQTRAQLQSLNVGRRKAIEWKRAKALRDAYLEEVLGHNMYDRFPIPSVGDTYAWLTENGHFLRSTANTDVKSPTEGVIDNPENNQHCPICGLASDAHSTSVPPLRTDPGEGWTETRRKCSSPEKMQCSIGARSLPMVNIKDIITTPTISSVSGASITKIEIRELLQASNPDVVQAIQIIVRTPRIPRFRTVDGPSIGGRSLTERELAPYALLSLVMQLFARALVKGGVEISKRNIVFASRGDGKKKRQNGDAGCPKLLTPVHIIKGIMARKDLISKSLAPLGMGTTFDETLPITSST